MDMMIYSKPELTNTSISMNLIYIHSMSFIQLWKLQPRDIQSSSNYHLMHSDANKVRPFGTPPNEIRSSYDNDLTLGYFSNCKPTIPDTR